MATALGLASGRVPVSRWRRLVTLVRPTIASTTRLTVAAVLAYLLTLQFTDGPIDLTGALTALLVVQASAYSTVRMGLVRVGAVLTGVLVSVALTSWVGLTWWSLGAAIAVSLLLATILRLGAQALETPISAMLILGVGGQEIAAETRVLTTLIGAGVGVALNLLLPPRVPTRAAMSEVRDVAGRMADCLRVASESMAQQPITRGQVGTWLEQARTIEQVADRASTTVEAVAEVRRLNTRAIGTTDLEPALRRGLDALSASLLAVRSLFVVMRKEAPRQFTSDDGYGEEVRAAFAVVLEEVAGCLDSFGALVQAEAEGVEEAVERELALSLEITREARAILTELLLVDARTETSLWLLRGSILVALEQVLSPLDLEERARLRRAAEADKPAGLLAPAVPIVRAMLPSPGTYRLRSLVRRARRLRRPGMRGHNDA